jgi:hypothetical protein
MAYAIRKNLHDPIVSTASDAQAAPQTIFSLIEQFDYVEKLCEEALTRQEKLARQYYEDQERNSAAARELVEVKTGEMRARADMSISDISFKDFKQLHRLAQAVVPGGLPKASRRFVMNACTPGFVEIEDLEETIKLYRYRMSIIEQEILDHVPGSAKEAVAKLNFMSSLMLDGGDIEVDFFAYLVEECAFVIASKMTGL